LHAGRDRIQALQNGRGLRGGGKSGREQKRCQSHEVSIANVGPHKEAVAGAIRQNIETIARIEEEFNRRRTLSDRIADVVSNFMGSMTFVGVHAVWIGAWIAFNLGWLGGSRPFDPFPFMLLSAILSIEAIFLSTFVLIKQSRMSRRVDERAHLDLQINLLSEREMTVVLQMLESISARLGVKPQSEELRELAEETQVEAVANELQKAMATEEQPTS
jgi:uncharacterized membrane protein